MENIATAGSMSAILARRKSLDFCLRWFRQCLACGSGMPPIDSLCEDCLRRAYRLIDGQSSLRQDSYAIPVYSLFSWGLEGDEVLRSLAQSIKGGIAIKTLDLLSGIFLSRRAPAHGFSPVFVYPGSRMGKFDHAAALATIFARHWPTAPLVRLELRLDSKNNGGPQKHKDAVARLERGFEFREREKISRVVDDRYTWVIVDDVITTGATAMAALGALNGPKNVEVWTLLARQKLAVKSGF